MLLMCGSLDSFVTPFREVLVALSLFVFPQQTGPRTHGGWVEVMRSTSTGEAQSLGSRNAPAGWPGTALTPSTTATATQTMSCGKVPIIKQSWTLEGPSSWKEKTPGHIRIYFMFGLIYGFILVLKSPLPSRAGSWNPSQQLQKNCTS